MTESITITIGSISREYVLRKTNAPRSYDGFHTLTVYQGEKMRLVLIDTRHLEWHQGRYASGLFSCEEADSIPEQYILEKLWKKILQ